MADSNELCEDSETSESVLLEELAVLESIYITELSVEKDEEGWPQGISVLLHPATGMDESKKYVCMTLCFELPHKYPEEVPGIVVKNPRGLGEEELQSLIQDMKKLAEERKGGQMLFELIEMAKDCLTEENIPHCECAICLEHFQEGDDFIKTDCYHYFHRSCLARFAASFVSRLKEEESDPAPRHVNTKKDQNDLPCPMCRMPLTCDLSELLMETVPEEKDVEFVPSPELIQQQQEMETLYEQQKAKGGIIDLEKERNKYLVDENTVVSLDNRDRNLEESKPQSSGKPDGPSGEKAPVANNQQTTDASRGDSHSYSKGRDEKRRESQRPATDKPHPRSNKSRKNHRLDFMDGGQGYSDYEQDCADNVEDLGDERRGDRCPKTDHRGNRNPRGGGRGDRNAHHRGEGRGGGTAREGQRERFRNERGRGRGNTRDRRDNRENLRDREGDPREGRTDTFQNLRDIRKDTQNKTHDRGYHHKVPQKSTEDDWADRGAPFDRRQDHGNYRNYRRGGHRDKREGHRQGDHDRRYQGSKSGRDRPEENRDSPRENRAIPRENRASPRENRDAVENQHATRQYHRHKVEEDRVEGRHSPGEDVGETTAGKGQTLRDSPREGDEHPRPQKSRNHRRDFQGHDDRHDHHSTGTDRHAASDQRHENSHGSERDGTQPTRRDDNVPHRGWYQGRWNDYPAKRESQRAQGVARQNSRETDNVETMPEAKDYGRNRRNEGGRWDRTFFRGQGNRGGGRGRGRNRPSSSQSAADTSHRTDDQQNSRRQAHTYTAHSDRRHDKLGEHEEEDTVADSIKHKDSLANTERRDKRQHPDKTKEGVSSSTSRDGETEHFGSRKTPANHQQHGRGQNLSKKENMNPHNNQSSCDRQHEKDGNFVSSAKDSGSIPSVVCTDLVSSARDRDSVSSDRKPDASKTASETAPKRQDPPPGFANDRPPPPDFGKNAKSQSSDLSAPAARISPPPSFGST